VRSQDAGRDSGDEDDEATHMRVIGGRSKRLDPTPRRTRLCTSGYDYTLMHIQLDHYSPQAQEDRRVFLDLVAAAVGGKETYLRELERVMNDTFWADAPAERATQLLDAAVQVARTTLRAWAAVIDASQQDVMHVLESEWRMELEDDLDGEVDVG
jgi:hypothetical protein